MGVPQLSTVEERRAAILDAALALFAERGYHGTSVPDVIARARVGASTLYRLYPSKEALVNAVFVASKEKLEQAILVDLDRVQAPHALFHELWRRLVRFSRHEPLAFHFLELQDHTAYLTAQSRGVEMRVLGPIFAACSEFQAMGVFTRDVPPEVILAFVWGALVGLVKAERTAYLKLSDAAFEAACESAWRAFAITK
jgi:AcrR family transcriptional regulator